MGRPKTHKKRLNLTPVKHGYTPERHPMKKQKGSKPTHDPPRELKISVRDEATEDLSFEQSPKLNHLKGNGCCLPKDTLPSLVIVKKNVKVILNC